MNIRYSHTFDKISLTIFDLQTFNEAILFIGLNCRKIISRISKDIDMECFAFDKFGTDVIKQMKLSPDSFIQTALQVTIYKLKKNAVAHYESAGLRRYRDSRTECIRSTSMESIEFAKLMSQKKNIDDHCLKELMIKAINAHKTLVAEVILLISINSTNN